MLKRIVSLGLLCMASQAHASITVTTTADIDGTDSSVCSLRDAIKLTNSTDVKTQIGGCVGSDATSTIILEKSKTYTLNKVLPKISKSVVIQSTAASDVDHLDGSVNSIIVADGKFRIFDNAEDKPSSEVSLVINNVDLKGCGTGSVGSPTCDSNGGVIYNAGSLTLSNMRIYNGSAINGGAIYNTGPGTVNATSVELKNNNAEQQGAGIWSQNAAYIFSKSLFRNNTINTVNAATGFVIYTLTFDPKTTSVQSGILDSTIYNNSANAINIGPGVLVGGATIVSNHGGVTLNSQTKYAGLFNSIIGDNNGADCKFLAGDQTPLTNLVFTNSCASGIMGLPDGSKQLSDTGVETLLATGTVVNGRVACALSPAVGLLCPFTTSTDQFNGYLLPRLLYPQYKTVSDSPIVNKGNDGSGSVGGCDTTDQRGKTRTLCDIGAIELVVPSGNTQTNGEDISYGQISTLDLTSLIGDGQLIPKDQCQSIYGPPGTAQGGAWMDGCLTYTLQPKKGLITSLDATTNLMVYTPSSDYHGYDIFSYKITSTTSHFSTAKNNQTITVTTTINQSPTSGISSKTVGAGGVGVFALVALMGLALRRRLTGGQL